MFDKEFQDLKKILSEVNQVEKPKVPMTKEEEADEIVRRLATHPTPPDDFRRIVMPMIRKVLPTLIANEIIGVQPMTGPVGEIHTLPIKKNDSGT